MIRIIGIEWLPVRLSLEIVMFIVGHRTMRPIMFQNTTRIIVTGDALVLRGQGQEGRESRASRPSVLPLWMRCVSRLPVAQRRGLEVEDG